MSLENFNDEKIKSFFELTEYKHLIKLILALDELGKPSKLSDIQNCFVSHRQGVRYSSLIKIAKKALEKKLIEGDKKYSLTEFGKQRAEFLKKSIAKLMDL